VIRLAVACALTALALLAANASAAEPSGGCSKAPPRTRYFTTFTVDGVQRSALVNVPPGAAPGTPLPLLLMFHGAGSTGPETERTIWLTGITDRFGFIVVYPDGNGSFWDLAHGPSSRNDDIEFVRQLLDVVDSQQCVDDSRVYAAGGSWGGGFVTMVACELSDRIAAVATVAGIYGIEPRCVPPRPMPLLEIHGTADTTVPYYGSGSLHNESVAAFLAQWRRYDQCPAEPPSKRHLGRNVLLETWAGCADGTAVEHVRLTGEEHVWPRALRSNRVPFNASLALLEFFSSQTVEPDAVPAYRRSRRR
jgi:polyhydroxybutyrate depolymerase